MLEFILEIFGSKGDAVMAWVQFIPAIISGVSAIGGAISEGVKRKKMQRTRNKWAAENENMFNRDYYSDYTQRADAQNIIRQMRDDMKTQAQNEANKAAITGGTIEQTVAANEGRNRAMANLYRQLGAQGQYFKDRAKDRYLRQKQALQGLEYDDMSASAQSSNNLMYNGISGIANMNWADILSGTGGSSTLQPTVTMLSTVPNMHKMANKVGKDLIPKAPKI